MGRHKADDTPHWLRAALDAARRPRRAPVGGFVLDGPPRTRAQQRRGDALAVPGVQALRAAMYPVQPRERLTAPAGVPVARPPADDLAGTFGDHCAVCGHPHVETSPCFVEPVEPGPTPPGGVEALAGGGH